VRSPADDERDARRGTRRKTRKQTWEVRSPADQVPAGAGDGALDRRSVWEQVTEPMGAGDGAGDGRR
jgi:hypothetical protein